MSNKLQSMITPNAKFGAADEMFINSRDAWADKNSFFIDKNGTISFDTYYNGLSTVLWKEHCGLDEISFRLTGEGKVRVRLMVVVEEYVRYELNDEIFTLSSDGINSSKISLKNLNLRGIIYPVITALSDAVTVTSGDWITETNPKRDVKLGISITHFDRKNYVLPSIERIKKNLLDLPEYKEKVSFTVVDNSQNITKDEALGCEILPNENTGGSGGFMRGLLHYMDKGDCTHVLFMDDDASCEIESIKRTYAILQHAIKDNAAVSGALFYENRPNLLIEKGARFERFCIPFFNNWNMADINSVIKCETLVNNPNYGGWWFFAFPINKVETFTFPFFVRGDDVFFGLHNKFSIITTNGVACYGEDFAKKVSPMTCYFDTRNNVINSLITKASALPVIKTYIRMYMGKLFAHQYGSVNCIRLALKHIFSDNKFWLENYDMKSIRPIINEISSSEKMLPIDLSTLDLNFVGDHERKSRRLLRIMTLNGFLLPKKDAIVYQEKSSVASLRCIFRFSKVVYFNRSNSTGYIAKADNRLFFNGLIDLIKDCYTISSSFKKKHIEYNNDINKLASKDFWEKAVNK